MSMKKWEGPDLDEEPHPVSPYRELVCVASVSSEDLLPTPEPSIAENMRIEFNQAQTKKIKLREDQNKRAREESVFAYKMILRDIKACAARCESSANLDSLLHEVTDSRQEANRFRPFIIKMLEEDGFKFGGKDSNKRVTVKW